MKTILKLTLVATLLVAGSSAYAQKFGYIKMDDLISLMPENDSAMVKLQALQKELSEQLEAVQVEFNTKALDYQKNAATLSDAVKEMRQKELDGVPAALPGTEPARYAAISESADGSVRSGAEEGAGCDRQSKQGKQFHAGVQYGQRTAGLLQRGNGNRHPSSVEKGIEPERQADYSGDRRGGAYGSRDPGSEITGFTKYKKAPRREPFFMPGMPRGRVILPIRSIYGRRPIRILRWFR